MKIMSRIRSNSEIESELEYFDNFKIDDIGIIINRELLNSDNYETIYNNAIEIICEKLFLERKKLKLGPYKRITQKDTVHTCSICLDNFKEGTYKRELCCGHVFHKKCIDKWVQKDHSCPICRKNPFI